MNSISLRARVHTMGGRMTSIALLGFMAFMAPACGDAEISEFSEDDTLVGEAESALTGYTFAGWGTTTNMGGIQVAQASWGLNCFLAGVAGNLSNGSEMNFVIGGDPLDFGVEARAWVRYDQLGHQLIAHGGGYADPINGGTSWANKPVMGQAACFPSNASTLTTADWESGDAPQVITTAAVGRRCFLRGIWGVQNAGWSNLNAVARVFVQKDPADQTWKWFVEGNTSGAAGSRVMGACVDFPSGTSFTEITVDATSPVAVPYPPYVAYQPKTVQLTTGTGVKTCALTMVQGAFNNDNYTDGALLTAPSQANGNWTATVSARKKATFICAE